METKLEANLELMMLPLLTKRMCVCVFLFFPPQFSGVVPGVVPRTNSNGILSGWHRKTPLERTYLYVQYMYPIGSM